jgi:hypothetical protein
MLIADIICTDEGVTNVIKNKVKREVSCGYDLIVKKGSKGFEQTQIRGNHLALVENARAGQKAAIQDAEPDAIIKQKKEGEQNKMKGNFIHKMFAAWAKDAEPAEIEQALSEMGKDDEPAVNPPTPNQGGAEKDIADLKTAVAEMFAVLKQLVESDKKAHEGLSDEEKLNALEGEGETDDSLADPDAGEEGKEQLIEAGKGEGEEEKAPIAMDAAVSQIVKAMKPKLLAITDEKVRTQTIDAFCAVIKDARAAKKTEEKNDYGALLKAVNSHAITNDTKPKTVDAKLSEQVSAINKYNAQNKKEEK